MATRKPPKPRPDPQRPPAPVDDELALLAAEMGMTRAEASRMLTEAVIAVALRRAAEFADANGNEAQQPAEPDQRGAPRANTPGTDEQ